MYNAAIIIFKRSTLPKFLRFFALPSINQIIEAGNNVKKVKVHIIECPLLKNSADNRKVARLLYSLCMDNNIGFFIGRNTGYYFGSGLPYIEHSIKRGSIDEVRAIKGLAALIKLSAEKNTDLIKKNMCFIGESYSYQYISTMLEEAAGVFIYEHEKLGNDSKKVIFEKLMDEKGISAVFTKDLDRAISECDIILADDSVDLNEYQSKLSGKILIGSNSTAGNFERISQVLLWYDSLEGLAEDNSFICFNDEMLAILRHFYKEKDPIDFIRRLPYIYLSRNRVPDHV